jgi:hypothetical protein
MRLHCLDAESGEPVWQSERVYGQSWGTYCPVVVGGKVIANTMRSVRYSGGDEVGAPYAGSYGIGDISPVIDGEATDIWKIASLTKPNLIELRMKWIQELSEGRMPEDLATLGYLDSGKIVAYYRDNPHMATMQVRDEETGQWQPVVHWRHPMMGGPAAPPARWKDGTVVTGVALFNSMFGRLDLDTGHIVDLLHNNITRQELDELRKDARARQQAFGIGTGNGDETVCLSIGGDIVYAVHTTDTFGHGTGGAFSSGCFDMRTRRWHRMNDHWRHHKFRGGWQTNDKTIIHGTAQYSTGDENRAGGGSPVVIAEGRVYHVTFESTIIARTTRTEAWVLENFGSLEAEVE